MRKVLKVLLWASVVTAVLFAVLVARSTAQGRITWYFAEPTARLTVDGRQTGGWIHRGNHGRTVIVTRNVGPMRESYWAWTGEGVVAHCSGWTAPHFPVLALNESNGWDWTPVCVEFRQNAPERNVIVDPHSVEFTTNDGHRLRVSW
jgi:hypothetical protein